MLMLLLAVGARPLGLGRGVGGRAQLLHGEGGDALPLARLLQHG